MSRKTLRDYIAVEKRGEKKAPREERVESSRSREAGVEYNTKLLEELLWKVNKLYDSVNELRRKIDSIESKLEGLEKSIEKQRRRYTQERGESRSSIIKSIMEKMNSRGYIIASRDIPPSVRENVLDSLRKMGAKEINLGDDLIIVHPIVYNSLFKNLSRVSIQDPIEASELMGEAKQLFQELVRMGILFFDFKKRKWVLA